VSIALGDLRRRAADGEFDASRGYEDFLHTRPRQAAGRDDKTAAWWREKFGDDIDNPRLRLVASVKIADDERFERAVSVAAALMARLFRRHAEGLHRLLHAPVRGSSVSLGGACAARTRAP
jgi:hypothetical protein